MFTLSICYVSLLAETQKTPGYTNVDISFSSGKQTPG